jgi:hypothetical protein
MSAVVERRMSGALKPFDAQNHQDNDQVARDAMLAFLRSVNTECTHIENPNVYGIDLLTLDANNEVVFCWELERRVRHWVGDIKFPFKTINCFERKDYQWRKDSAFTKNIPYKLAADCKVFFVQMNDLCNRAAVIDGDIILKHPLVPHANRFIRNGSENIRQIPVEDIEMWDIKI